MFLSEELRSVVERRQVGMEMQELNNLLEDVATMCDNMVTDLRRAEGIAGKLAKVDMRLRNVSRDITDAVKVAVRLAHQLDQVAYDALALSVYDRQ